MTRKNAGKYAAKHPPDTQLDPALAHVVQQAAGDKGEITCAAAFVVAAQSGVLPSQVGETVDLLELRITKCQLGLFGYEPGKKLIKPAEVVADDLRAALLSLAGNGEISCAACWETADRLGVSRLAVASACDRLGLKITPCQLGAF